jgi:outer membrane protein assembly factor BamB
MHARATGDDSESSFAASSVAMALLRAVPVLLLLACGDPVNERVEPRPAEPRPHEEPRASDPPRDDRVIAALPIAWSVELDGVHELGLGAGVLLVGLASSRAIGLDARDGRERYSLALSESTAGSWERWRANTARRLAVLGDVALVEPRRYRAALVSLEDGSTRRTHGCVGDPHQHCPIVAARAGDLIVTSTRIKDAEGDSSMVTAMDANDGRVRWRSDHDDLRGGSRDEREIATDGPWLLVEGGRLVALAQEGAHAWSRPPCLSGAVSREVYACVTEPSPNTPRVEIMRTSSGASTGSRSFDEGTYVAGLVVVDDVVFAAVNRYRYVAGTIVAIEPDGRVRFRRELGEGVADLIASGPEVWALGDEGTLWRIDPSTGATLERYGLPGARLFAVDVHRVYAYDETLGRVLALDRGRSPIVATVRGHASFAGARRAGLRVHIGETIAVTGEDGAFSGEVETHGGVSVWVEPRERVDEAGSCSVSRTFVIAGSQAELHLDFVPRDCARYD